MKNKLINMSDKVCVVIPIHAPQPTGYELISFEQCFKVLNQYPIKIIAPEGLNLDAYKKVIPEFEVLFINPKWQSSIINYNKLKRSRFFYSLFNKYEFLLTYELDAFVFRDDLLLWCEKSYDYIGAPWFVGYNNPIPNAPFQGVGNSGFSLRKVKPIQHILKTWYYKNPYDYQSGPIRLLWANIKAPYRWLMSQTGENYTIQNNYPSYEDIFFSDAVPKKFKNFKVAPIEEAMKFSFEVKPEYLYELTDKQLPMGCHAWWRYNLDFWRPFIEAFGYKL